MTDLEAEGEVLWAMTDHLGSVRDVIDSNADLRIHRQFDTFGNIVDEVHYDDEGEIVVSGPGYVTEAFAFTGRWRDDVTGQQHNLFRWYDPATGSWISEDPKGLGPDANPNRYVRNMPTMYVDPRGLAGGDVYYSAQGDNELAHFHELQQAAQQGRPLPPGYTTWTNPNTGYVNVVPPSGAGVHKPTTYNGPNLYGYYLTHPSEMDSGLQTAQTYALVVAGSALGAAFLLDVAFVYGISQAGYVSLQALPHTIAYEWATWGGAGAVAAASQSGKKGNEGQQLTAEQQAFREFFNQPQLAVSQPLNPGAYKPPPFYPYQLPGFGPPGRPMLDTGLHLGLPKPIPYPYPVSPN